MKQPFASTRWYYYLQAGIHALALLGVAIITMGTPSISRIIFMAVLAVSTLLYTFLGITHKQ
jgi:hypothetical protein